MKIPCLCVFGSRILRPTTFPRPFCASLSRPGTKGSWCGQQTCMPQDALPRAVLPMRMGGLDPRPSAACRVRISPKDGSKRPMLSSTTTAPTPRTRLLAAFGFLAMFWHAVLRPVPAKAFFLSPRAIQTFLGLSELTRASEAATEPAVVVLSERCSPFQFSIVTDESSGRLDAFPRLRERSVCVRLRFEEVCSGIEVCMS